MLSYINKINESIEKATNPLKGYDWVLKNTFNKNQHFYNFNLPQHFNTLDKSLNFNNYQDWANNINTKLLIESINKISQININTELLDKISSDYYWSYVFKISLINEFDKIENNDELNDFVINVAENLDDINISLEEINNNPVNFFNEIFISLKDYINNNPSIKYSSKFIIWLISIIIIPILLNKFYENGKKDVILDINITNNNYFSNDLKFGKININDVPIKNFPRNSSKTVYNFNKHDKVQILKDSLKWALIIKINSIESGWVRKEYLNFTEN